MRYGSKKGSQNTNLLVKSGNKFGRHATTGRYFGEQKHQTSLMQKYSFAGGGTHVEYDDAPKNVAENLTLRRQNAILQRELARARARKEGAPAPSHSTDLEPEQFEQLLERVHQPQPSKALISVMTSESKWDFI